MKHTLLIAVLFSALCASLPTWATPLTHMWSARYGDADAQGGSAVATDAAGNVYVAGDFSSTVNFGGGNLTSAGGTDIFLAKFDASGNFVWAHGYGDVATPQVATALAVDAAGNVYMGGVFFGTVDFGNGPLTSAGDRDVFIAKFNPAGVAQWSHRYGDTVEQELSSLALDPTGSNLYAAGNFLGSMDFGGGPLTGLGGYDIYLVKFDSAGNHQWSKRFGDSLGQTVAQIATDPSGNVCVTGTFFSSVDFGGGPLVSSGNDVFLVKFDAAGNHQWSHGYGDASNQSGTSVATDASGNIYMAGYAAGTTDFGGGPLTSAGGYDVFLVKFDPTSAHQWSHMWGDAADQTSGEVAIGPTGNVYLGGTLGGTVDFGGGPLVTQGVWDVYLVKFDSAGGHQWSQRFGDASKYQLGNSVATDPSDNVLLTGLFQGSINFGGGPLTSAGSYDVFLAKFGTAPTGVRESPAVTTLSISAYPNPFNPETTIRYTVPSKGHVTIDIYDARGAHVATLVDATKEAGAYSEKWDGRDARSRGVSSGVYFARVTHPSGTRSYKLVLLK